MSSGPGKLQNTILSKIPEGRKVLFREILWEIAISRDEIDRAHEKFGVVEFGTLKKSFVENARRAVDALIESKKIYRNEGKIDSIDQFIEKFEFFTSKTEIYFLRKNIRPYLSEFIRQNLYKIHTSLDYEEFQIQNLREEDALLFLKMKKAWQKIEEQIFSYLAAKKDNIDLLLDTACRGSFLFLNRRQKNSMPLHYLGEKINSIQGDASLGDIGRELIKLTERLSEMEEYKMGVVKNILYQFVNVGERRSPSTSVDFKKFLLDKNPALVRSLPGHKDPEKSKVIWLSRGTEYSPLLDKIIDKSLFRKQIYLQKI